MSTHLRNAHLNLVQSSRQLFEFDPGAIIEEGEGWVFGAGRSSHPAISNAAFRTDDGLAPVEFLERARGFFAPLGRGFAVWVRGGTDEDRALIAALEASGLRRVHASPEMVLEARPDRRPAPDGIEMRRVGSQEDADDYWRVAAEAYKSIDFPPEIFAFYEDLEGFRADNVVAFLARVDGRPAGIAMTIVSHGVAGIYWVGSLDSARGRGLGSAVTAAAVDTGFELGAEIASLQASPMGESLYRRMGFEKIFEYQLYLHPTPEV